MRTTPIIIAMSAALLAPTPAAAQRWTDFQRWDWSGSVATGRWVTVRNLNGAIRVEAASGPTVEVRAEKRARRNGRVEDVTITAEQQANSGDVLICARWNDRTRCDEDGYSTRSRERSWWDWSDRDRTDDVTVEFTVRVPKGVRIAVSTVNGGLEILDAESEVDARTVNGSITAHSNGGPVTAKTVNGSLRIRSGAIGSGSLDYTTVNGAIELEIPGGANAELDLRTVNGSISSDFPITIDGRFNNRRVRGNIGNGGPLIRLTTTNGSIRLRRA